MEVILDNIEIISFELDHIDKVKIFTDEWIGINYYTAKDLELIQNQSSLNAVNASFLAFEGDKLIAIRLSLAPQKWTNSTYGFSPSLWNVSSQKVAYFKSLFIHQDYRNKGLGKQLSQKSQFVLSQMGAKAILAHSWLESPANSSQEYLKKFNFIEVAQHTNFWKNIEYLCTRCKPEPCVCTAIEMIKYIK